MWDGLDRRRFPRAKFKCKINIKRKNMPVKVTATYTDNLGPGGMCVVIDKDLNIFRHIDLELHLNDKKPPVSCRGAVVWVVKKKGPREKPKYDTGIEFIDLKEEDKKRLSGAITSVSKNQDDNAARP